MTGADRPRRNLPVACRLASLIGSALVCAAVLGMTPAWASIAAKPAITWQTNGRVDAILDLGGTTYLGGSFTQVSDHAGHTAAVGNLAAIDANGNLVAAWTPKANHAVKTLATDGSNVLAGGAFTTVNGKRKLHLALISSDGRLIAFKGHTNKEVDALAVSGPTVYAGGLFTKANGTLRNYAAAFAASGGGLTRWNPSADGRVDAIVATSSKVVLGGMFSHVGGKYRAHLTGVDPVSGAPGSWATYPPAPVLALTGVNGSMFAGIGGRGGMVAAFDDATGSLLWQAQTDGNVQAITVAGGQVIPGGHFNNFCDLGTGCRNPVTRHKIAALDEQTGALDPSWHPVVNSKLGVFAALGTASQLEIGGDFTKVAGVAQAHFARFATS
jgi:hypothetical protein